MLLSLNIMGFSAWFLDFLQKGIELLGVDFTFRQSMSIHQEKIEQGEQISHSNHKTKRLQFVNLQYKRIWRDAGKRYVNDMTREAQPIIKNLMNVQKMSRPRSRPNEGEQDHTIEGLSYGVCNVKGACQMPSYMVGLTTETTWN